MRGQACRTLHDHCCKPCNIAICNLQSTCTRHLPLHQTWIWSIKLSLKSNQAQRDHRHRSEATHVYQIPTSQRYTTALHQKHLSFTTLKNVARIMLAATRSGTGKALQLTNAAAQRSVSMTQATLLSSSSSCNDAESTRSVSSPQEGSQDKYMDKWRGLLTRRGLIGKWAKACVT